VHSQSGADPLWLGNLDDVSGDFGGIGTALWTGKLTDFIASDRVQPHFEIPTGQNLHRVA